MKYWRRPLGRNQLNPRRYRLHLIKERCKGCRFCIEFCPRQVLEESGELNSKGYRLVRARNEDDCLDCGFCEAICPEFAVSIQPSEEVPQ